MILYTTQLAKWRKVNKLNIPLKDITVKSGDLQFSPTWTMLLNYKRDLNEQRYVDEFIPLMAKNYAQNKKYWLDLLSKESLCVACYCAAGKFCHRHLIVDIFERICIIEGIPFKRGGEIT